MGGKLEIISKSSNINDSMESELLNILERALDKKDYCDFITTKCKELFGGSWMMIHHGGDSCNFEMSFAFNSLKWIKLQKGNDKSNKFYLFQISE